MNPVCFFLLLCLSSFCVFIIFFIFSTTIVRDELNLCTRQCGAGQKKGVLIWHKPITFQETVVPRFGWCEQISNSNKLQVSQSKLKVLEIQGQVIDSIIGPPSRWQFHHGHPWTILGRPATGLARNPEVGARRRNCQGSMSCWSAWANIKTRVVRRIPVVYVPESEARLYETISISGMIINPLIGIYSDLYTHHVDSHYEMDDYEPYIIGYMPRIYPLHIPTIYPRIVDWPLPIIHMYVYIYMLTLTQKKKKHRLKAATCHPPAL